MIVLRLKELRLKANLTQNEVAKYLNTTQPHYSRWELGKQVPDANQILQLCEILSCSPNDLFGIHGDLQVAIGPLFEGIDK